ncbi:unnamed protein product [Psylliodes chrysocephalus]|uniref:RRM domain-containing protein n=1 Tax=Psylliodes chrysocephalus TaxID=3402493 RepID=A0A9P0CVZ9_9CUCU|nr:unnamed protein product [Psylliodes chrysocephala]
MIENSSITSESDTKAVMSNEAAEDGLLKLQLEDSEIPEISIDVTKLDVSTEDTILAEESKKSDKYFDINEAVTSNIQPINDISSKVNHETSLNSKSKGNFVWVSNLRHGIKATAIKKFFSQIGRVTSVKILTNGKSFYAYVSMESLEMAAKCISDLNESLLQGDKIIVTKKRPDIDSKTDKIKKKNTTKKVADKENKTEQYVVNNTVLTEIKSNSNNNRKTENQSDKKDNDHSKQQMQTKIDSLNQTNKKLKQRLDETTRLYDGMCKKYQTLKEDFNKVKLQTRQEQKRLNQERESFEKMKKLELSKIEANKDDRNKELIEIRKLKESLKQKLNNIRFEAKNSYKRKTSPLRRPSKSPRRRITPTPRNGSFRNRDDQRADKKFRRGVSRDRTPPPPNLNNDTGKKRIEVSNSHLTRPTYYSQSVKQQGPGSFEYRQNRSYPVYPIQRTGGNWLGYQRNVRRTNSSHSHVSNPDGRFNGPVVQHPVSAIVVPPRAPHGSYYYPQW